METFFNQVYPTSAFLNMKITYVCVCVYDGLQNGQVHFGKGILDWCKLNVCTSLHELPRKFPRIGLSEVILVKPIHI
jgi:hypothetical protein